MRLAWFGIFLLSFSWLRSLYFYIPPQSYVWYIALGISFLIVSCRNLDIGKMRAGVSFLLLVASALAVAWLNAPFQNGFVALGVAALISLFPFPSRLKRRLLPGLWIAGMVMVVQTACVPLLYVFSARYHATAEIPLLHDLLPGNPSLPWLATLLFLPLKLISWGTTLHGSTLYLPTSLDTLGLTPTWEKAGLVPLALFAAGALLVMTLAPAWRKRTLKLLLLFGLYAYIRLLVLFLVVNHFRTELVFWWPDYQVLSFLPLPIILAGLWPGVITPNVIPGANARTGDSPERSSLHAFFSFAHRVQPGRLAVAAILFAAGITLFWNHHDPGTAKQGRVWIDERHSNWEWTTQPFDTTWYGGKSGYNFYCLADYWNHFYQVETGTDSLTPELLSGQDILIIKTPTAPFSPPEVDAIEQFVANGGGLFLIGDHTNVFGTSTYLNPIAQRFGLYFRYDATYNLINLGLNVYDRPHRFAHPIVQNMPTYLFATSCSMYAPLFSENVILGYGLRAMYLDYSEKSYFPVKAGKMNYDFGLFLQAGGVKYGKGRVLGYTDSTCFSNFFMFIPGKPELALGSIEWLNRTNRWAWLGKLYFLLAIGGCALAAGQARRNSGPGFWNVFVIAGTLAVIAGGWLAERDARRSYAPPRPHTKPVHVAFDSEHGSHVLPVTNLPINDWRNFQTFYVWTQRLGIVPRNDVTLEQAVRNSSALVEIHPVKEFTIEEIDLMIEYVRTGGTLIVIDSPLNTESTANTLLGPFMMAFDSTQTAESTAVVDLTGDTLGVAREAIALAGGNPLYEFEDERMVMGYIEVGAGTVIAFGASYLFSTEYMGTTAAIPTPEQRKIYQAEYDLFTKGARIQVEDRYRFNTPPAAAPPR